MGDGMPVPHDDRRREALKLQAHVHKTHSGLPRDHVGDFTYRVLNILHNVFDGVAEHLPGEMDSYLAVEGNGKRAAFIPRDADHGGHVSRALSVFFEVWRIRRDFPSLSESHSASIFATPEC